jgi:hypothetical protein
MSFSAGGAFLPSPGGMTLSAGQERISPVEYRRSQRLANLLTGLEGVSKDHTVFVKGYQLGSRSLYLRSFAQKIMYKSRPRTTDQDTDEAQGTSPSSPSDQSSSSLPPSSRSKSSQPPDTPSDFVRSTSFLFPEWPVSSNACHKSVS